MARHTIATHVQQEGYRRPVVLSLLGHLLIVLFFGFAVDLVPEREPLILGSGPGGGQGGEFVTVGLSDEFSGGAGMYKPALTPRPAAAPVSPVEEEPREIPSEPEPSEDVFVENTEEKKEEIKKPSPPQPSRTEKAPQSTPQGAIPREPDPGSGGPGGRSSGAGGGFGGGQGVSIGSGTGEGTVDSWYVRRVEQRIGENWLRTSLGRLPRSVQTVMSFEIRSDGQITDVHIDQSSGIRSVDLAAERAVRASSPLPPVPYEFRNRRVKFIAYFQYPPR